MSSGRREHRKRRRRGTRKTDVLVRAAAVQPGERVLDLGTEGRVHALGMQVQGNSISFVCSDIRDIPFCQNESKGRESGDHRSLLGEKPSDVVSGCFDVVVYRPHQRAAKEQVFEWLDDAFALLPVGGRLCLAGRRDRGVESYAKRMQLVFGSVRKVAQESRSRVYRSVKSGPGAGCDPVDARQVFQALDLPGGPYIFRTKAGVFSWDGIDPGTRCLIECLNISPEARVLDLGCGYGAIGVVCARLAPRGQVGLVDASIRAVACARANIRENAIPNATAMISDGFEAVGEARFDLVVSNPPFHEGNATAHPFIDGAAAHLAPGGRLVMVVMRPEPYRRRMAGAFHRVETLAQKDGYTVLAANSLR